MKLTFIQALRMVKAAIKQQNVTISSFSSTELRKAAREVMKGESNVVRPKRNRRKVSI